MTGLAFFCAVAAIFCGLLAGIAMLRKAWRLKSAKAPWRLAGLSLVAASVVWPAWAIGEARGPFVAMTLLSLAAFVVIASGYTLRPPKTRRDGRNGLAPEPAERASSAWRTALRWSLAGPIGMVAAMALGISYAVWAPGEVQTRLLIGGLVVPLAWGGAMAWTLADSRILRAAAVLTGTAVAGFGAAMLRGIT